MLYHEKSHNIRQEAKEHLASRLLPQEAGLVALSPGPTQKIGKEAWCHLQTFLYVQSQHGMQQLHALRAHMAASYW